MQMGLCLPIPKAFRTGFAAFVLVCVSGQLGHALTAQQSNQRDVAAEPRGALDPITATEEATAERVARSDARIKEILGEQGVRLVSATPVLIKRGESAAKLDPYQREIEVLLFRPQGEVGVRVLVDLRQNRVADVQRLSAAQVPFTNDDLNDAFQLALRDTEVRRMLGPSAESFRVQSQRNVTAAVPSENVVTGLPIRSSDPKDPCSKHRCLQLFFRRGTDFLSTPGIIVDLSTKQVSVERSK